jgi:cardiolipin synthase A/B
MKITKSPTRLISALILSIVLAATLYGLFKPIPDNTSYEGEMHAAEDVSFLYNRSINDDGERIFEEEIFSAIIEGIEEAEEMIVLDVFMFNDMAEGEFPGVSREIAEALIHKKENHPEMPITVITDPINTSYYSHKSELLNEMEEAGIQVVITDITNLQDSNPLYSGVWRAFIQWFGQSGQGWIENPFDPDAPEMTARSILKLMNGRANHRKVFFTEKAGLISSANIHDESYYYTNTGFQVSGKVLEDIYETEQAVLNFSSGVRLPDFHVEEEEGDYDVQVLTEGANFQRVQEMLDEAEADNEVWIGVYFISDPEIIESIEEAALRGVEINMILDPNESAFGIEVFGMPNRPVAEDLMESTGGSLTIRWYNTLDEQFHPKMMAVYSEDLAKMIAGSANFSSRNMRNNNLDTNLYVEAPPDAEAAVEVREWFEEIWYNESYKYTAGYEEYENPHSAWRQWVYRLQKISGVTTY